jgi:hypothetical protein
MSALRIVVAAVIGCMAVALHAQPSVQRIAGEGLNLARRECATGSTQALSALRPLPSRSPGGLLYQRPPTPGAPPDGTGWWIDGCVEPGVVFGDADERSALFRTYRDPDPGALLHAFWITAEAPRDARFFEAGGGNTGRNDQYTSLRLGRHNAWSFATFFNETPHVTSDSYRSLWSGVGSPTLTLASPSLVPGGLGSATDTQAVLRDRLADTPATTLQLVRRKAGLSFDARVTESLRAFLSLTSEHRQGARPFGAVFGGGDGGGNLEVPQSIDDDTHRLSTGLSYADATTSVNLELSAAQYRNRVGTQSFENPLTITPNTIAGIGPGAFTHGTFALDPDNEYTSGRFDLAYALPHWFNARFTASVAVDRARQNEPLLAPTSLALTGASLHGVPAGNAWNTTAALTRERADARITTRLVALKASLQPWRTVSLSASYRDDSTDNDTNYLACNPQTGQPGRLLNDGSGAALVDVPQYLAARCDLAAIRAMEIAPDAGDITLRSVPYEQRRRAIEVTADWRARRSTNLTTQFEHTETERSWREREQTSEDRLKLTLTERGLARATVRASAEYAARRGSEYRNDAGIDRVSASLGPLPASGNVSSWFRAVDQLRKFDLADRTRTTVQLRADVAVAEGLDVGMDFTGRYAGYAHSEVGRVGHEWQNALGLDANFEAADGFSLHGFYSFQEGAMQQRGAQPAGCVIGLVGVTADDVDRCGALGGPLFPRDRTWAAESRDRNHVAGLGGQFEFRWGVVSFDYTYARGRTSIDTVHGSGIVLSPERAPLAERGWPDLRFRQSTLSAGAWLPLTSRLSLRLRLQREAGEVDDWHYDGTDVNPVPLPDTVYLTGAPQSYRAIFGGIFVWVAL